MPKYLKTRQMNPQVNPSAQQKLYKVPQTNPVPYSQSRAVNLESLTVKQDKAKLTRPLP